MANNPTNNSTQNPQTQSTQQIPIDQPPPVPNTPQQNPIAQQQPNPEPNKALDPGPNPLGYNEAPIANTMINPNSFTSPENPNPLSQGQPPKINLDTQGSDSKSGFFSVKKAIFAVIVILLLLIPGGSLALSYTNYELYEPPTQLKNILDQVILTTPLPKTPRIVLENTLANFSQAKTATIENETKFEALDKKFPIKGFKFTLKGPFESESVKQTRSAVDISGEVATEGLTMSAAGSVRQIGDIIYFKVTEFPGGAFEELNSFKNQWFFLDIGKYSKQEEIDYTKEDELAKEKLENFAKNFHLWSSFQESQNKEKYSILVKPPQEDLFNLIYDILNIYSKTERGQLEIDAEKEEFRKYFEHIEDISLTLTVDKKLNLLDEIVLSINFEMELPSNLFSGSGNVNLAPQELYKMQLTNTTKFTEYNLPVIIEIPSGAKDIVPIIEEYERRYETTQEATQEASPLTLPQDEQNNDLFGTPETLGEKTNIFENLFKLPQQVR